ncbi:MAG TPA: hypothetical protein PLB18_00845, partial [Acidobacteriota bacterium]|nr:hypothetical protein [Acidobacteriota bacterium]
AILPERLFVRLGAVAVDSAGGAGGVGFDDLVNVTPKPNPINNPINKTPMVFLFTRACKQGRQKA